MMRIQTNCPLCGPVQMWPKDVHLRISLADENDGSYTFLCPSCRVMQTKTAPSHIADILIGAGVVPRFVAPPVEKHIGGPPLDIDDLRDFVRALNSEDYLADVS